jgi:hypothetical protein
MAEKDSPSNLPRTESLSDTVTSNASDVGDFDINVRVQMHGILMKQPFVSSSKKWQKRFFIIKEGFLLYYGDTEAKKYDKNKIFNTHPKVHTTYVCIVNSVYCEYIM